MKPQQYLFGELGQSTARGRQRRRRNGASASLNALTFFLPKHNAAAARRPYAEHPTAGPKTLKKHEKRAPEAGITLSDRPEVLPIPARDGRGGIWAVPPTLQTFFLMQLCYHMTVGKN